MVSPEPEVVTLAKMDAHLAARLAAVELAHAEACAAVAREAWSPSAAATREPCVAWPPPNATATSSPPTWSACGRPARH